MTNTHTHTHTHTHDNVVTTKCHLNGALLLIAMITIVGPLHPRVPHWWIQTTTGPILLAESGDVRTHRHRGLSAPHPFVYMREHAPPQILVSGGGVLKPIMLDMQGQLY